MPTCRPRTPQTWGRFAELGVFANYTPWWHFDDLEGVYIPLFGEDRGGKLYRCKSVWDTGAIVTWSSDTIAYMDFATWNPFLGMEIGLTRWVTEKTKLPAYNITDRLFPPAEERMGIEEMVLGYTINGALQLGIESTKGSITCGKDADFLVFDEDLLTAEPEGLSYIEPAAVYFGGTKVK